MKKVLIIAHFCSHLSNQGNNRFYYLANRLSEFCEVEFITSSFSHKTKKHREPGASDEKFKKILIYEPSYKKNVSIKRLVSHRMFGNNVKKYLKNMEKKPDVIYCAVPSLGVAQAVAKYAQKNNIRFIVDIQDLWPEAYKMVFNLPIVSDILFMPFKRRANKIYGSADEICAVSKTYANRGLSVNKKCKNAHAVFLGTNLSDFDVYAEENRIKDKPADELWLGYCGTLGNSYDLKCVFDALNLIRKQGDKPPKFIVMGTGPRYDEFKSYADDIKLDVQFTGNLPYPKMCGMLSSCDIVVNPITAKSAATIINKHADYAACGLPVINTQESDEYKILVEEYEMGFNCNNSDARDMAEKMKVLIEDAQLRKNMGENARKCAEEKFDRKVTYQELIDLVMM